MSVKTNLVRCLRCKKTLIREEFEEHDCIILHRGVRHVEISRWSLSKNERGEPLLMALGIDGYVYRLTQTKIKKEGFEELEIPDESLQENNQKDSDEDLTTPPRW